MVPDPCIRVYSTPYTACFPLVFLVHDPHMKIEDCFCLLEDSNNIINENAYFKEHYFMLPYFYVKNN